MFPKVVFVVLLASVGLALGQRDPSIEVMNVLKELQPRYREIQDFVINRLTEARLNSSQVIYNFHTDVITAKDQYVRNTIDEEQSVLTILDRQPESVDRTCLGFVRSSVDMNVNLIGVSYTNCIVRVDDSLADVVQEFYRTIQQDETQYTGDGLFGTFRGENIFHAPESLAAKLNEKLEQLRENPTNLVTELFDMIVEFEQELKQVKTGYDGCLESGMELLRNALAIARTQVVQVCLGELEAPTPSTNLPE
uniref:Protein TsetseEP domain-containing protein n=1 Tax=Anopheles culicifacies TaxID=139723 RepID=A0A182MGW9_9DIPT